MVKRLILVINPGSTTTKFAIFEDDNMIFEKNIRHLPEEIASFETISSQFHFRKNHIMNELIERKTVRINKILYFISAVLPFIANSLPIMVNE